MGKKFDKKFEEAAAKALAATDDEIEITTSATEFMESRERYHALECRAEMLYEVVELLLRFGYIESSMSQLAEGALLAFRQDEAENE